MASFDDYMDYIKDQADDAAERAEMEYIAVDERDQRIAELRGHLLRLANLPEIGFADSRCSDGFLGDAVEAAIQIITEARAK